MTTTAEVYFLVRVGSWDEDDLENWVQERMDEAADQHFDHGYEAGHKEGTEEGQDAMYKEALEAVKCLR
jgi:flagellar biosynthesis/type III secretory pathway protein FliH